ncbi:MAG: ECF transporter S component [Oscillospiraceae bacterium]|nr:ECF transporter S component [Oscillospiraceae bacterium]
MKNSIFPVRALSVQAMLAAIGILLTMFNFPIIAAAPFLRMEFSDIPVLLATAMFGIPSGLSVLFVVSVLQSIMPEGSGFYGFVMHMISTGTLLVSWRCIYRIRKNHSAAALSGLVATLFSAGAMIPANLIITPIFMGLPRKAVADLLLPGIIPFNLIKAGVNTGLAALLIVSLHKVIQRFFTPPVR